MARFLLSARKLPPFTPPGPQSSLPYSSAPTSRKSRSARIPRRSLFRMEGLRTRVRTGTGVSLCFESHVTIVSRLQPMPYDSSVMTEVYRVTYCRFGSRESASARPNWAMHKQIWQCQILPRAEVKSGGRTSLHICSLQSHTASQQQYIPC
jgi:hypothetical protein